MVCAVEFGTGAFTGQAFEKFTVRGANDFATASVAVTAAVKAGVVSDCRIVLGGAALRPVRCLDAESLVIAHRTAEIVPDDVADVAVSGARAPDSAARIDVLQALVARAMTRAFAV
ncbi:hypothetical protein [Vineibacter terrae]|uniref:hypothetical protein n=1 Tax=Vineibacter terrae TaxID=2586908 RepID=UPI002E2F0A7E|nr:hypothetical protein [Vineibacter terrae]HEX2885715.1 hypothetical protein [Vineibacter terrae]